MMQNTNMDQIPVLSTTTFESFCVSESLMRLVLWGNKNAKKGASLDGQGTVSAAPQQQPL